MTRAVPVAVVAALLFAFVECGGRTDDGSVSGAAVDRGACIAAPPAADPKAPSPTTLLGAHSYAIRKLHVGDADRSGNISSTAWRGFGFDIDGRSTPDAATGLCRLASGASQSTHRDGDCGIDNSFGARILPVLLTTFGSELPASTNAAIANGGATDILVISDIAPDAQGFPASSCKRRRLVTCRRGTAPTDGRWIERRSPGRDTRRDGSNSLATCVIASSSALRSTGAAPLRS